MITKKQLDAVERFADKLWAKVGLDIEFTRHFLDRLNDSRNKKDITPAELTRLFRQSYKKHGKKIGALGTDAQAILKDMETDINMPFVIQLDKKGELDLVAKTVMRKKGFTSSNQQFTIEDTEPLTNKYTNMEDTLQEALKLTNDVYGFMGTSSSNGQDYKKNLARVTKAIRSTKLLASDDLIIKYLDSSSGRHLADYLSFKPDAAKLKNYLARDILSFKKRYLSEAIKLTNDVYGFMGTSAANGQDYKKNLARVTKIIKRNKLLASDALIVKYLDSSSGRHLADYFSFEPDDAKLKNHLTRDILVFKKHVLGLSEEFDQGPLTEAKKITASTIAKLFKNTKEWGDDLKNQIRVVKGHLEVVDSFYFSSTDAVKRMISAWTTPNGSYAQYFKSEYGVTFKLVDKFTLISATGRYKKVSDDGIAGIILSVHSDALKESEELEEAAAPFKSLEAAWLRTGGDKKKQAQLIKKHELKPIISNVRPGSVKLGPLNKLKAKGAKPHTIAGLDAEGELIFVTNNPTKIYYPKASSGRPAGAELKEASMQTLRLRRVVELSVNESNVDVIDGFLAESSIDLTWTPTNISRAFDKYLNESTDLKEAKAETYDYLVIMKLLRSLRLMPSEQIKILGGLEGKGKKGVYTWDAIEKTLKETGFGKFAAELHGNIKPHMIGGSLGNKAWSVKEETLDEASEYKVHHKAFYAATEAAIELVAKRGFEVDEDDWFRQVSTGPKKPSDGKTNQYHVELTKNGKNVKKKLHFQVYGMGKGTYELNAYVESTEAEGESLAEAASSTIDQVKKIVSDNQAAKINGKMVDMWTASMIVQIYDKVNDATKKKIENEKIEKLVSIALKMMESVDVDQACAEVIDEAKSDSQKDIADLEKMIKNPDPSKVKEYGGTKYVDMLKKKLNGLKEAKDGKKVPNCVDEKLDKVGSEDDDVDNDGDVDASDKYLKKRRNAITKATKKD